MAAAATGNDGDRDLDILMERKDEAMVDMAGGLLATKPTAEAHGAKRKEATSASSSETCDYDHDRDPKRKEASALLEDDGAALKKERKEGDSLFKEGEMLRLWGELREADHLWDKYLVPGALDRWLQRKKKATTQVPAIVASKKKKKVVRVIVPDAFIDYIMENPGMMRELSDEEMAKCPKQYRQMYAIRKVINAKKRAYQQALIDQYRAFGFAYNEKEVSDDEEEEEVVVKN